MINLKCTIKAALNGLFMDILLNISIFAIGVVCLVFAFQLFRHNKAEFKHNHALSESLSNALVGNINEKAPYSSDEVYRGFTVDIRSGELVPCSQLSKEAISRTH